MKLRPMQDPTSVKFNLYFEIIIKSIKYKVSYNKYGLKLIIMSEIQSIIGIQVLGKTDNQVRTILLIFMLLAFLNETSSYARSNIGIIKSVFRKYKVY